MKKFQTVFGRDFSRRQFFHVTGTDFLDNSENISDYSGMADDLDLVEALGGGTVIAAWLTETTGETVDRETVYKWKINGVPYKWRPYIARLAASKGVALPDSYKVYTAA